MNYDDSSHSHQQQQQFYMQRIPAQQQRMVHPIVQNQQNMPQQLMRQQQYAGMMHPHPQQVMVRMPQTMNEDSPNTYQQQHPQFRDIIQTFPTHLQNQINAENNPEKKKQLFQAAMKHQQQQQHMFEQQIHGGMQMRMPMNISPQRLPMQQTGGGMVYPNQQIMQQSAPTQIQRIPSQSSFGQSPGGQSSQQMGQIYVANTTQMNQNRVAPMQPMPINQPYVQQHQISHNQQQSIPQQIAVQQMQKQSIPIHQQHQKNVNFSTSQLEQPPTLSTGMTMNAGVGQQMKKIQNSQILQHQTVSGDQQPLNSSEEYNQSVQGTMVTESGRALNIAVEQKQPRSVGTPLSMSQQQQNESETLEYKTLFDRLRTYHGDIKRILDRLNIDYPGEMKLKSSLINVIQVMEGTRKTGVNCQLLRKLLSNVQTVLEQYSISRHLIVAAKKLNGLSANARELIVKEPLFIDPWSNVRHLQIRLPSGIINSNIPNEQPNNDNGNYGPEKDSGEPPAKRSLLTLMAESFSPAKKFIDDKCFKVKCMDGSELILNSSLSLAIDETTTDGFSIDFINDQIQIPVSSNTSTVQARFTFKQDDAKFGIVKNPSLDLLLPVDYPKSNIQILSGAMNDSSESIENLMEQIDSGAVNIHSLVGILESWRKCLEEE